MKNLILITALFILPAAFAQPNGSKNKRDKIEELKIAFITKELNLTPAEAQQFWPIYNEMEGELRKIKKEQKVLTKEMREDHSSYSENDFKAKSNAYLETNIKEAQIRKEYHSKIAGATSYEKATKLISVEQKFKRELLQRLKNNDKRVERKPGGKRPH